jgi:hypothetical protein
MYHTIEILVTGYRGDVDETESREMEDERLRDLVDDLFGKYEEGDTRRPESHVKSVVTLTGKRLDKQIVKMTKYDKYAYIKCFVGAEFHANKVIATYAAIKVDMYKSQKALGLAPKDLQKYEPGALKPTDQFYSLLDDCAKIKSPHKQYLESCREVMNTDCSMQYVHEKFGGWPDRVTKVTNGWVVAVNSPEGPEHKKKHVIIYGKAHLGKTSFVRNVIFKGMHRSVIRNLFLFDSSLHNL